MLCEKCQKNLATTFLKLNEDGQDLEKYLCQKCYNSYSTPDLSNFLNEINSSVKVNLICNNCGTTTEDVKLSGAVGCAYCYEMFNDIIKKEINGINKNMQYTGKIPSLYIKKLKIEDLQRKIDKAISDGNFKEISRLNEKLDKVRRGDYEE